MSNGIVAFTSRVVGVSRDARASRRRRARAMKISFDRQSSRAVVARAMPSGEDRNASASAFAATSPSDSFFASSSVTSTFGRIPARGVGLVRSRLREGFRRGLVDERA